MLLSDAFPEEMKEQIPALECRARLININYGCNRKLMEKCQRLAQYSELVSIVRNYQSLGMDKEEVMRKAWEEGMKRGLVTDILSRNGTEATSRTAARDRKRFDLLLTQEKYEDAKRAARDSADVSDVCAGSNSYGNVTGYELAGLIRYCCHRRDMMIWKMHRMIQRV